MRLYFFLFTLFCIYYTISAQTLVDGDVVVDTFFYKKNASNDYISLYQRYVSKLKNGRCAMYPSCSNYGLMVFSERNFFEATSLLSDRLIRCSHDEEFYASTKAYGYNSYMDFPYYNSRPKHLTKSINPHTDIIKTLKDSTLLFVNSLINSEEYENALLEINKAQFFKKGWSDELYAKKLLSLRALNEIEKGIYEYNVLFPENIKKRPDVAFEIAKFYYLTEDYNGTINILMTIDSTNYNNVTAFKAITYARQENIELAQQTINNVYPQNSLLHNYNKEKIEELKLLKKKSPALARGLSIIPGMGYLYSGHKGSALTSFVVNSILAYATYTSIKSNNYGVAGLMGFMSLSFYIGNINGAGRSAHRYNLSKKEKIISNLEKANYILNN